MGKVSNYFVEIVPDQRHFDLIMERKQAVIAMLTDKVADDPTQAKFLRDEPHFTMMCSRIADLDLLAASLEERATRIAPFDYFVRAVETKEYPDGFKERRTVVRNDDHIHFYRAHHQILASCLAQIPVARYERFKGGEGLDQDGLTAHDVIGFPGALWNFDPHASVGRVAETHYHNFHRLTGAEKWNPVGEYEATEMKLWALPFEERDPADPPTMITGARIDPKATPELVATYKLTG